MFEGLASQDASATSHMYKTIISVFHETVCLLWAWPRRSRCEPVNEEHGGDPGPYGQMYLFAFDGAVVIARTSVMACFSLCWQRVIGVCWVAVTWGARARWNRAMGMSRPSKYCENDDGQSNVRPLSALFHNSFACHDLGHGSTKPH